MTDDREAKLPQWARDALASLRHKLAVAETVRNEQSAQLAEYASRQGPGTIELEPYRSNDPSRKADSQIFSVQAHVRIKGRPDARRSAIDVRVTDDGFVELAANDGQLVVMPSGGQNVIRVATACDYEMARTRDLQKWEDRLSLKQAELSAARKTKTTV